MTSDRSEAPARARGRRPLVAALVALTAVAVAATVVMTRPSASGPTATAPLTAPVAVASPTSASPSGPTTSAPAQVSLPPASQLGRRWGSYVPEREWGTPREAVGSDGWGLGYVNATTQSYRYAEDGIAGVSDQAGDVVVSWAFWDGERSRVTERYFGSSNPQGEHGESIVDDRVFREHSPTHAYGRQTFRYGAGGERPFAIDLEFAKADDRTMVLRATARSEAAAPAGATPLHVVVRAVSVRGPPGGGALEAVPRGLLIASERPIAVIGAGDVRGWQASDDKGALDANLRAGGLTGAGTGRYGALDTRLELAPGAAGSVTVAISEAAAPGDREAAISTATAAAAEAHAVLAHRRAETTGSLAASVTAHGELYEAALHALLWNESLYRWDGESSAIPRWTGKVDARDVLIMPDKWEYPYVAAWDSAFHAVTAALVDPAVAKDQLRFLLSDRWQQPDGHVPCAEWVMELECPPVFGWAAWRISAAGEDRAFLAEVYPALRRQHRYWQERLQVEPDLYAGGFLGMDNLPRAAGRPQADGSAWMAFFARHLALIADALGEPADAARYREEVTRISAAVNARLWNEATGLYHDLNDARNGFLPVESYSGLIPLIAGIVPDERLPRLIGALRDEARFLSPAGIRSVPRSSGAYRPGYAGRGVNSNWLGPVWMPITYLLIQAVEGHDRSFADALRERVVRAVEADWKATGRFHEYFHGDTGEGLGADEQGWTLLVANLIRERWGH